MKARTLGAVVLAAAASVATASAAGAAPGGQSKNTGEHLCTSGTLAGQRVTVPGDSGNSVYLADGTHLRVTAFRGTFTSTDGSFSFERAFGSKQGDLTCGGSESDEFGTFTFFATAVVVP